jgi:putative membrane-bound dehydrogenase-like protein
MNTTTNVAAWWKSPQDHAEWQFTVAAADTYDVVLTWGAPQSVAGQRFVVEIDGNQALKGRVEATGGYASFVQRSIGQVRLGKGHHTLVFRPAESIRGNDLLDLKSIALAPFNSAKTVQGIPPHKFTLRPGYAIQQVAAPPLVLRPIHMCFDDQGALYVTDSSGNTEKAPKQLKDPRHRVLRLVDADGDGVFDRSTVFAEHMPFPEGILVHGGAVYIGAPPHIWKLRDTNGDYVADEREVWFNGGSIEGCGNDMHGPYLGPDGFFYWCKGAFAAQKHVLSNGRVLRSRAAHVYRAKPDGTQLEVVITGGMNNPVGLAFSDTGERFLSGTFFDLSKPGRRDGILHAVYGGVYGRENKGVLASHPRTGGLLPILTQLGPSASSGIVMLKNPALSMKGELLCADFNLRRISRHRLARAGSSYSATTRTLLESDNTDFHPTDVIEDANGSLLVADTGSWYMICCPTSKVAKPKVLGAIYRIAKEDSADKPDPRGLELDWTQPSVSWLADERPYVVNRAIDALAKKETVPALRHAPGLPAVWTLNRIDAAAARQAVREFLRNPDANVRVAAINSVASWRDAAAVKPLIDMLAVDDQRERRLAAMALGRIGDRRAVQPLLKAAAKESDAFLRHAIIYALYEIGAALPGDKPLAKQVQKMHAVDKRPPPKHVMPDIALADSILQDPARDARRNARLDELAEFLPKADSRRGEKLFADAGKSLCITCHVKGGQGVEFGPDLTMIGAIRSERDLLEAIVYPSSSIARYYELLTVKTAGGDKAGLLARDTIEKLVLAPGPGVEQVVAIQDIKSAKYSNVSMMPEVFDTLLKPQEIADIVAYLKDATKLPPQEDE